MDLLPTGWGTYRKNSSWIKIKQTGHRTVTFLAYNSLDIISTSQNQFYWWNIKLFIFLTNYALYHEGVWGTGCIDTYFLVLGTTWKWVVSFTTQPLYPEGNSPLYTLDRGLVDPRVGLDNVEKRKVLTLPWFELQPLGRPARTQSLWRLLYSGPLYVIRV
jgi:hypothetical protein